LAHAKAKLPISLTPRQIATIGVAAGELPYSKSGIFADRVVARLRATAGHSRPTDEEVEAAITSAMTGLRHYASGWE
jgi:hypothetical protein